MPSKRWAVSAFIVWHLVAILVGALGTPAEGRPAPASDAPPADALSAALSPVFDRVARSATVIPAGLELVARPVRRAINTYLQLIALGQNWRMFSVPPKVHQYLRVRYYIGPRETTDIAGATWTATELIMPAHREDEVRWLRSYRDSFTDKALAVALQKFQIARDEDEALIAPDTRSADLPDDLAPVARYYARRFVRVALQPEERLIRTEVWYGSAPIPAPGSISDRTATDARWEVLRKYYEGPVEDHFGRPVVPGYYTAEKEADIVWILEYFEP